ncbi:MAG: transposase [Dysgonomonas sp.]|nr:transposase [Dysgonomonas sp.]
MKKRKVYDREFKENAVRLSSERDNLSQFARELGISVKQLYSWRSQYKIKGTESFPGNGNTAVSDDAKAFAQLKKEHARLQQEHEILKKAMGIISRSDL